MDGGLEEAVRGRVMEMAGAEAVLGSRAVGVVVQWLRTIHEDILMFDSLPGPGPPIALWVGLGILFVAWGWLILAVMGVAILARVGRSPKKAARVAIALYAFLLAFGWQQVTAPLNFGVRYGHIRSQQGNIEAFILHRGSRSFCLVIRRGGKDYTVPLRMIRPGIFWIEEGKTIGVVGGDSRMIVDVDLWTDPNLGTRRV